ncbi:uncharacterized protein [Aegilops tauschii subsp. strangulata]|uniref:uncharacterized protein n=1 Tax=Aegilops tauschii subsp. strangulata TaxID=200361 RepID=UPI003CC8754F
MARRSSISPLTTMVGRWFSSRKTRHNHEAGSSSGRCRRSTTPPPPPPPPPPRAFHISPDGALPRQRPYVKADVYQRYWETGTPLPWSDAHLPNNWHLSMDRVPILPVAVSGRARRKEINRRRARLPPDLVNDWRYALDLPL